MVLSTTRRTASIRSIINHNQGGGNNKAGFAYTVGRGSWSSQFIGQVDPVNGKCCKLSSYQQTLVFTRGPVRPISMDSRIPLR